MSPTATTALPFWVKTHDDNDPSTWSVARQLAARAFQILIEPSEETEATSAASGDTSHPVTSPAWPKSAPSCAPRPTSHRRRLSSLDADTMNEPSAANAHWLTLPSWPSRSSGWSARSATSAGKCLAPESQSSHRDSSTSSDQRRNEPSAAALTTNRPSGLNAQLLTQ